MKILFFSVVSVETASATEEIAAQVDAVQVTTREAVVAIGSITGAVTELSGIASAIAAAVEEQHAATAEIARSAQDASCGLGRVTTSIAGVSEGVLRATTVIQDNAALIGKVALPREMLVLVSVAASFAINLAGFLAIVVALRLAGQGVHIPGLLPALLLYVPLFALALGVALVCASVQVFVRDLAQALGQLLPLLMFGAPVYYDRAQLPERFRALLDFNPFTFYAESFRAWLLDYGVFEWLRFGIALLVAALVLLAGHWLFRRLDPHFEDFL